MIRTYDPAGWVDTPEFPEPYEDEDGAMRIDDGGAARPRRVYGAEARRLVNLEIRTAIVAGSSGLPGRKPDWVWDARCGRSQPADRFLRKLDWFRRMGRKAEALRQVEAIRRWLESDQPDVAA